MIKNSFTLIFFTIIGLFLMGVTNLDVNSNSWTLFEAQTADDQTATPAINPTQPPATSAEIATPVDRLLPPVGSNASLVIGASVLVLIIIGGVVLSARRKEKH